MVVKLLKVTSPAGVNAAGVTDVARMLREVWGNRPFRDNSHLKLPRITDPGNGMKDYLDHVVEYEVGEDGEGVGADLEGVVVQPGVHLWRPGFNVVWEPRTNQGRMMVDQKKKFTS